MFKENDLKNMKHDDISKETVEYLVNDKNLHRVLIPMHTVVNFVESYIKSINDRSFFKNGCQLLWYPPHGLIAFSNYKDKS